MESQSGLRKSQYSSPPTVYVHVLHLSHMHTANFNPFWKLKMRGIFVTKCYISSLWSHHSFFPSVHKSMSDSKYRLVYRISLWVFKSISSISILPLISNSGSLFSTYGGLFLTHQLLLASRSRLCFTAFSSSLLLLLLLLLKWSECIRSSLFLCEEKIKNLGIYIYDERGHLILIAGNRQ